MDGTSTANLNKQRKARPGEPERAFMAEPEGSTLMDPWKVLAGPRFRFVLVS